MNSSDPLHYKAEVLSIKEKKEIHLASGHTAIGFVRKGELFLSGGNVQPKTIKSEEMFFFPPDVVCSLSSSTNAEILYLEIPDISSICHHFLSKDFYNHESSGKYFFYTLSIHPHIKKVVESLEEYIRDGVADSFLIEIKMYEFFHFLTNCYNEELIRYFFSPVLIEEYKFAHFVLNNYKQVRTVEELAKHSTYSLSGFEKQFRKVFGIAPYKWMLQRKTENIYRDINETSKPLKLIAEEYEFTTLSRLTDFCRRHIGVSPSEIRNKWKK